jgi:ATP-dependent exoDNAse (exonuclease V) beta subunit
MNGRIAVSLGGDVTPPGWEGLVTAEKDAENEERERWMYVAATRARDQLVIVREDVKQNLLQETAMSRGLVDGPHGAQIVVAPGVHVRVRSADRLAPAPSSREVFVGLDAAVDAALAAPPALGEDVSAAHRARVRGAVRAGARKSARWRSVQELSMRARVKGSADGVGKLGGVVVHDVMNRLDLSRPREALLAEAPGLTLALSGRLDEATTARCVDVVRRLLQHPVLDRARAAPERWQEAPFTFADRGRTVAGTIDLCFPLDNARTHWMVVDWKSSLPPEGSPLRADYERQLAWYARALLATVGAVSVETCLVGPHPELGAVSAEEQALDGVHDALSAGLRALLDRGAPVPAVGLDVGEPVVAQLELAWPALRVGLALDLDADEIAALRKQGWTVHDVATDAVGWPEAAVAWLGPARGRAAGS